MQLFNFTIIKLTICLITGICIGYLVNVSLTVSFCITALILLLLAASYYISKKQFIKTIWFGFFSFLIMISLGILSVNLHNQKNFSKHYSNKFLQTEDSLNTISFRIREVLKSGNYYDKYIIDILKINDIEVNGKSLLNIKKDSLKPTLNIDDILITRAEFKSLIPPLNPDQFDYKSYLEKQHIYHQLFIKNQFLLRANSKIHTVFGMAAIIRKHINFQLKKYKFTTEELAIINALFLGQRQDISQEVFSNYANAGAIHILAVSGLHIGIILIILNFLFKPIEKLKNGYLFKTILLVSILWGFAIIAGLSASVTRAVTMFSIVAIAMHLKRPTNIYNTLAISMFVILLFKPLFLFDVGFQLSYLAVFAIVVIDPFLYNLWKPKNWFLNKYWHTLTITISAQFGIIPISLYYFHQFPSLFFISNLVIIPLLGFILGFGIFIILLASFNKLPQFLADSFGYIISTMNNFVEWISQQHTFLFQNISFNLLQVLASYVLTISIVRLFIKKNYIRLRFFLIGVLFFQISFIYTQYQSPKNEFIIFHKSRNSLIGNISNNKITVTHNFDSITSSKNNIITNYMIGNHINSIEKDTFKNIYMLNKKVVLVIDSLGLYNIKSLKPDYVYLRQSPKINLNRLIDSISPKQIIADGSNYKSYIQQWVAICEKRKLPFHHTSKKGAFIIKY